MATEPITTITAEFKASAPKSFAALRARGPVQRVRLANGLPGWAVLSYEEAREALVHAALLKNPAPAQESLDAIGFQVHSTGNVLGQSMLFSDPPDHTRLRRLVAPAFSPRRTELLAGRVQEIADALIDAFPPTGEADLTSAFTEPLPIALICELLGVPFEDREDFQRWSRAQFGLPGEDQRAQTRSFTDYLDHLVERKRSAPGDDVISDLIAQQEDGDRLTHAELIGTAMLLVIAGHETTANLLGNAMVGLFRQPEQADLLRSRPELLAGAVEEFLRFDSSVEQATMRFAAEDLELGGVSIQRGDVVAIYLGPAGREAPQWGGDDDPTRLDVTRPAARHLAFGHGIHHCVGAPLARMEAAVALGTLLRRVPDLRLAIGPDDLDWIPIGMIRGPIALPVRYSAVRPA